MAEGLEPHHHIIRRAGPTINKHLNLADEALISRLITSGCISEKDRDKYTGKTKRVRDRFIARFQNQPYELFLAFVECLREDVKYSVLVTVLDEALAEYGYVPPTTGSHETVTQSEDVPSMPTTTQIPSPTTTDLTATTLPPDIGTIVSATTSLAVNDSVSSLSPHVAIEKILPSTKNEDSLAVAKEAIDSAGMETASSSDIPREAIDSTAEETSYGKMKLQRQDAVVEEKDEHPHDHVSVVSSQPSVDDITTSFSGLTVATKEGDFPRLPFEGDRETMTFTSEGGELFSFVHKFRIVVPPNAVPPGNYATLHVVGYSYGPFQLPTSCKPCSDFIFVEMEEMESFQLPVMVEISHNLIMESYEKCREVSICRGEYNGSFITADPSHQYPIKFNKITEPEVSNNDNVFSFTLKTFCGLCAVYDDSLKFPYLKQKSKSFDRHSLHHSCSGECPLHHNHSREYPLQHNHSGEYPFQCNHSGEHPLRHTHSSSTDTTGGRLPSFNSQSSHGSIEYTDSPLHGSSRKRKLQDSYSAGSQEKQMCQLEYVLLCYWPVARTMEEISVIIFVCKNCPTSIAACKRQVAVMSNFKVNPLNTLEKYLEFKFDESRRIMVDVEITTGDTTGWDIHKNTIEVHENDVEGTWKDNDDKPKWFKHKVEVLQYPPKIKLDISCDEKKVTTEKIKFTLHFSGIQETGYSKSCDKKVHLYARSKWFTDKNDDQWMDTPSWNVSSIDFDFSSHVITTRMLVQAAMEIIRFEFVARHLGLDENDIGRLQEDYETRDERCYQMLQEWKKNSSSPATLEELHRALCLTNQENCLPKILETHDNYESVEYLSSITDIPERILRDTVTDDVLRGVLLNVATKVTTKWRHVGRVVGLDDSDIDEIQFDHDKVRERAYQMLRRWRDKHGSSANLSQLVIALLIVKKQNVITYLKDKYLCL